MGSHSGLAFPTQEKVAPPQEEVEDFKEEGGEGEGDYDCDCYAKFA